jgi:hypothetical protein
MTLSGIEPATFRLVAQCLSQLRLPAEYQINLPSKTRPEYQTNLPTKTRLLVLNIGLRPVLRLGIFKRLLYKNMLFYIALGDEWLAVLKLALPAGEKSTAFNGQQVGGSPEPCLDKVAKGLSDQGGYDAYSTDGKNEKRRQNCSQKS